MLHKKRKANSFHPDTRQRLIALAVASACATLLGQAHAQEANTGAAANAADPTNPNTVVVQGIRASMQSTLNMKRNSDGFVDGIVADDIGKFPDTNLAEALQRISGVSIDRNRGEGALVTVRGVGPDLNLVLLNGRQMPTARLGDQSGRAFDFSNLASESVSQIQVYKSVRADVTPGGIGASLNILTGRPLDLGNQASFGAKVMYDESNNNLPGDVKAKRSTTPEVSGLYSTTWHDGMFGLAATGSYQSRNMGINTASVINGWLGPLRGNATSGEGLVTPPGDPNYVNIKNPPGPNDLYLTPQNMSYRMNGYQRQRTNGQLTFQFRPVKDLTTTLDYTYAENKIQQRYSELSAWFGHNTDIQGAEFTKGPLASPLYYEERYTSPQDISMNGGDSATKSTLNSLGFNAQWKVSPSLRLNFDVHHSVAEAKSDSPFGINNDLGTASFSRGTTRADFTNEMPVMSIQGADFVAAPHQVAGSWFQDGVNKMKIDQIQLGGRLSLFERSGLNFGLGHIKNENHSVFQQVQRDTWGGTVPQNSAAYDQSLWHLDDLRKYFGKLGGADNPNLFTQIHPFDFAAVRNAAIGITGDQAGYTPSLSNPAFDRTTIEKTRSIYAQFNTDWDTALPMHTGIGFRYEQTRVDSTGLTKVPTAIRWISENEFPVDFGTQVYETLHGKYNNFLPSVDWDMDLRPDLKIRASYGVSIGRARYDQIAGGSTYGTTASVTGDTVSRGNPALEPVKSKNLDLSAEWYYNKQSMLSLGLFNKNLTDYTGSAVVNENSPNALTPVGGKYWNAALASGCSASNRICIRNYILHNFAGQPGVTFTGDNSVGNAQGTITGIPGDPALPYTVSTLANSEGANLKGAEVNWQHMFANGFGFQANYTYVKSDLKYDNLSLGNQFALVGLSNSANLVGIYEDQNLSVRAAYNWRGEFLSSTSDNSKPNPSYVEPYGQLDLSVGYNLSKNLSLSLEAINLTDATQRTHGRSDMQVLQVSTGGRRYMVGARYKF
ncbi:TonB-dependent receptor [Massilia norwichensis]|uniref:TonB-dependent receptor n=1 Tax=Massilia norwichensis TaxID=1442366 RepID=A0ABT2A706_9BURK|nr:TonB-dependent receptor [Massilia norwichensis]